MSRGINDPVEEVATTANTLASDNEELLYEMQQVIQELINRHNDMMDKIEKLEDKLTDTRIQFEAQKLVWNKGL